MRIERIDSYEEAMRPLDILSVKGFNIGNKIKKKFWKNINRL